MTRRLTLLTLFIGSLHAQVEQPDRVATMPDKHQEILEFYCYECHDSAEAEGGLNMEELSFHISKDIPTAERWQKILNAMNSGEMPPKKKDQLTDQEKTVFLDDLSNQMVLARQILSDNGGQITLRRLNRREYLNTVEDLLGVRPDASTLPSDAGSGFDTSGADLFFSSDQLEQYLAVARDTLELSFFGKPPSTPKTTRVQPEADVTKQYTDYLAKLEDVKSRAQKLIADPSLDAKKLGFIDLYQAKRQLNSYKDYSPQLIEYLNRPETKTGATLILTIKGGGPTRVKVASLGPQEGGTYTIRARAAAYTEAPLRLQYLELTGREGQNAERLGWQKITGSLENPSEVGFTFTHPTGSKRTYYLHQRTHQDRGDKNLWAEYRQKNGLGTPPGVWVDWAEITGPQPNPDFGKQTAQIFFEQPTDLSEEQYAREILRRFATRAFRGEEPTTEFLDKLLAQYQANRENGETLKRAMVGPMSIILASPGFIYMVESSGSEALTDRELAIRLSYFLWSTAPDTELLAQNLSDPVTLRAQTERLLRDPRADRFIRGFTYQWLQMERLEMFQFDARKYEDFDNATRESAGEEIYATIHALFKERLPLHNLLKSDFIIINDALADFYGIPAIEGSHFRKVALPQNDKRGGLLGTVAVLAMGSDGLRSSPVERGAWVLRHLLNNPPPPAPPNVPQLGRLAGQALSARELQKAHQEAPQCAQCHQKIDPIGYALEHFDASGKWREQETVFHGKRNTDTTLFPIDPSGELSDGTKFKDYFELRDVVASRPDAFAQGFSKELIAYGLGRPFGFTDFTLAEEMVTQAKERNYDPNEFIHTLVQSRKFQTK
ncbi:MAG: DUF1592 domain-containing protein [Verrucomicrobiaceae bacterium]